MDLATVIRWDEKADWGFLKPNKRPFNLYFNRAALKDARQPIYVGARASCDLDLGKRGHRAKNVVLL
jgi:hypothetical protein